MDTIPFLAILVPLAGAVLIGLTGHFPNVRETITLITARFLVFTREPAPSGPPSG